MDDRLHLWEDRGAWWLRENGLRRRLDRAFAAGLIPERVQADLIS